MMSKNIKYKQISALKLSASVKQAQQLLWMIKHTNTKETICVGSVIGCGHAAFDY